VKFGKNQLLRQLSKKLSTTAPNSSLKLLKYNREVFFPLVDVEQKENQCQLSLVSVSIIAVQLQGIRARKRKEKKSKQVAQNGRPLNLSASDILFLLLSVDMLSRPPQPSGRRPEGGGDHWRQGSHQAQHRAYLQAYRQGQTHRRTSS